MKKFIDEARSTARGMDLLPEVSAYKKRVEAVEEAYSRIPVPPAGNDALVISLKAARQVTVDFGAGSLFLKFVSDFVRLGSKENADKAVKQFRELGIQQQAKIDELEVAVAEDRAPKIKLSDVIKGKQ